MQSPKIKMLVLSLTGQCNFACRYCYAANHPAEELSVANALAAVRLAAAGGERFVIQFSGGEPLLNFPCLKAVVEYVEQQGINAILQLQTNASLLTDEIACYLHKHKVGIGVSLDGRPAVNDRLRLTRGGHGATDLTLQGIEVLKQNNIACGITCVVTADNVEQLPGIVDMAYFLGNVRRIGFDLLRGQGRGSGLTPPAPDRMRVAMEQVYKRVEVLSALTGYEIKIAQQERAQTLCDGTAYEFGHCYAMNGEAAFVDAKGDIYACSSLVGDADFYIGNVRDGLDVALVERVKQYITSAMSFCKECADFKACGGGCFARWQGYRDKQVYESECVVKRMAAERVRNNKS